MIHLLRVVLIGTLVHFFARKRGAIELRDRLDMWNAMYVVIRLFYYQPTLHTVRLPVVTFAY